MAVSGVKNSGKTTLIEAMLPLLAEAGLRVPDDLSVIGLTGTKYAPYTNPPVTELCVSHEMIASAMISKITELLNMGTLAEYNITLKQYELVERESIRDLRQEESGKP